MTLVIHATQVSAIKDESQGEINLENGFTYCRICGEVFASADIHERQVWSFAHSNKHSFIEHIGLDVSGNWLTPEAAIKLAPYGVIPLADMLRDTAVAQAMFEAPRMPDA
jgi:hypothetical protein